MDQPTSPKPNVPMGMDFPTAIRGLINGKAISRLFWISQGVNDYGYLKNGWLSLHKDDGDHIWKVNDGDLLATDWIIQDLPITETAN